MLEPRPGIDAVVIDEIGKMECLAPAFVEAARRALTGRVPVLGTIALAGGGFIAVAKRLRCCFPRSFVIHRRPLPGLGPRFTVASGGADR